MNTSPSLSRAGRFAAGLALATLAAPFALAFRPVSLPGVTSFDGWANATTPTYLSGANYPTYASGAIGGPTGAWPGPVAANLPGSDGGALFNKTAGAGYFAGMGVYTGGGQGSFSVFDTSALGGIETIVFQFEVNYDNPAIAGFVPPSLNYNGGSQALPADYSLLIPASGIVVSTNAVYAYQWDLSSIPGGLTSFALNWTGPPFAGQITAMRLNQGDTFVQAVPEPGTVGLLAGAAALGFVAWRRRKTVLRRSA